MVESSRSEFEARLRVLGRKHRAMARSGATTQVRADGLMVMRPARGRRISQTNRISMWTLVVVVIGFFAFKGFMLAAMGDAGYADRLATLKAGTAVEQVGAEIMRPDRVSLMFASLWSEMHRE